MNKIYSILFLFFLCACANVYELHAQEDLQSVEDNKVIVYLKNGSKFQGRLLDWNQAEKTMTFDMYGNTVQFYVGEVRKIIDLDIDTSPLYSFEETGIYYHLRTNFISGNPGNRSNFQPGVGLSISAGKRFNRMLSIGGGIGFDEYVLASSENILSTFGELSGYFHENNQSLFYNVAAGYGFAVHSDESNIRDSKGGWMMHPSLGVRLGKGNLKWTIDMGYKFQKANWVFENWGSLSDQDILYRRLTLRMGLMF